MNAEFELATVQTVEEILRDRNQLDKKYYVENTGVPPGEVRTHIILDVSTGSWSTIHQMVFEELATRQDDEHLRHELKISIVTRGPLGGETEHPVQIGVSRSSIYFPFPNGMFPNAREGKSGSVTFTDQMETNYVSNLSLRPGRKFLLADYDFGDLEMEVPDLDEMLNRIKSDLPAVKLKYARQEILKIHTS
jgi:hypothetical protein